MKFKKLCVLFFSFSVFGLEKKKLPYDDFVLIYSEPPIDDFIFLEAPPLLLGEISLEIQKYVQTHDGNYYQMTGEGYNKNLGVYGTLLNNGFFYVPYSEGMTVSFSVETTAKTPTDNDIVKILFNLSPVVPLSKLKDTLKNDDICLQVLQRAETVGYKKHNSLDPQTFISDFKSNTLFLETHIPLSLYLKNKKLTVVQ